MGKDRQGKGCKSENLLSAPLVFPPRGHGKLDLSAAPVCSVQKFCREFCSQVFVDMGTIIFEIICLEPAGALI